MVGDFRIAFGQVLNRAETAFSGGDRLAKANAGRDVEMPSNQAGPGCDLDIAIARIVAIGPAEAGDGSIKGACNRCAGRGGKVYPQMFAPAAIPRRAEMAGPLQVGFADLQLWQRALQDGERRRSVQDGGFCLSGHSFW